MLYEVITCFKGLTLGSQAGRLQDLAQEQRARTLRMTILLGRQDASSRAELGVEARRMEDAQKLLLALDANTLSFADIPKAMEIIEGKPIKLKERAAAFAAGAAALAGGGAADALALQAEGIGAVSEGFIRLALIVHEQDKELQEKLLKYVITSYSIHYTKLYEPFTRASSHT